MIHRPHRSRGSRRRSLRRRNLISTTSLRRTRRPPSMAEASRVFKPWTLRHHLLGRLHRIKYMAWLAWSAWLHVVKLTQGWLEDSHHTVGRRHKAPVDNLTLHHSSLFRWVQAGAVKMHRPSKEDGVRIDQCRPPRWAASSRCSKAGDSKRQTPGSHLPSHRSRQWQIHFLLWPDKAKARTKDGGHSKTLTRSDCSSCSSFESESRKFSASCRKHSNKRSLEVDR
mmetsp:Transcript_2441/g.4509  ORF Transcript_2441/g.4509 Transcript_2441/m.4509 type:complete len:225 (+) Transcript_2441:641-1315(+)